MNAYQKLRPHTDVESCECASVDGLLLVDLLTDNPLHCDSCRKQVDPERSGLTTDEVEDVASGFSAARALYRPWLHSGEYEEYAKARLLDPNGQVNREGLAVARKLSARVPTRLWYFFDTDDGEPTHCPVGRSPLDLNVRPWHRHVHPLRHPDISGDL